MKHEFLFPSPPTLNQIINTARTNKFSGASQKKAWTAKIAKLCKDSPKFEGEVWLAFTWKVQHRRGDSDNIAASKKFILDGMVKAGVILRDNLTIIQSPNIDFFVIDKTIEAPCVKVVISTEPIYKLSLHD